MVKLEEPAAGMIKHTIQNDPDSSLVCRLKKLSKSSITTQNRINIAIIMGVIAVISGRGENGIQIDSVNSQISQVIQSFHNTQQIPTLESMISGFGTPFLQIAGFFRVTVHFKTTALCKTIGKDLVKNSIFNPIRGNYGHKNSWLS